MMPFKLIVLVSLWGCTTGLIACANDRANSSNPKTIQPIATKSIAAKSIAAKPIATKEPTSVTTTDPNQSVSSEQPNPQSTQSTPAKAMVIEGTVEQVMESYPLQLTVTTNSGRYFVSLQANTIVAQQDKTVEQGTLKPGTHVQITGQQPANADMALVAQKIQIR